MSRSATKPTGEEAKLPTLVLQGGGALGAYQAGVYEALAEAAYLPDWVAGISIGAINAAIIAGNEPADRVARLADFWETITAPSALWARLPGSWFDPWYRQAGAISALAFGQPGFFARWDAVSWFLGGFAPGCYDTAPLRATLERLVDFDRINAGKTRFSVGAVNVGTGEMVYFDNRERTIGPDHVMASAALPPGFPPVSIDGALYWDGGLVSNTPLQYVLSYYPRRSRLAFQVDLFAAAGGAPRDIGEAIERAMDIRYSSRTRTGTEQFRAMHDIRHNLNQLLEDLPAEIKARPAARVLSEIACVTTMDIAQIIYRPEEKQGAAKDFGFNRDLMQRRWAAGREDARRVAAAAPWRAPMPPEAGVRVFDVLGGVPAAAA